MQLIRSREDRRADLFELEQQVKALPQLELFPSHYFAKGLYGRELVLPAGSCITGMIHKQEHLVVILKGKVSIATDSAEAISVEGPCVFVAPAGTKRAFYTDPDHGDAILLVVHATEETTVAGAEATLVTNSYTELLEAQ